MATARHSTDYGLSLIPEGTDAISAEFSAKLKTHFHHFVKLQEIAAYITGCGSYLFDGNTTLDYCPSMYPKQVELYKQAKTRQHIVEVGLYAGHSALIMLFASDTVQVCSIDICQFPFTQACGDYLAGVYPERFRFVHGNSMIMLPKELARPELIDMYHIDGDHSCEAINKETMMIIQRVTERGEAAKVTLVYDDYDAHGTRTVLNLCVPQGKLILQTVPACPWRNCVCTFPI